MSIEKAAVISTSHIDPETAKRLTDSMDYVKEFGGWMFEYGWGFPCGWITPSQKESTEAPACLAEAAVWALNQDCTYLFFDQDGEVLEELPSWDW
jgi:hypothetical protein